MTAPDKPEGLIAGGEQVRSSEAASHNTPPAEEDRGEREWEKHARVHIAQIQKRFPNRSNWVPTARYLERALAELDSLRDSPLLSSPRVEEVRREAIKDAIQAVGESAWKHIGSDAYSRGMDLGATQQLNASLKALRALATERKE